MFKIQKLFKIILFFIFITTINAKEQPLQKVKLQLQWKHQFEFAGFYVAKEKGFYKDVGLDVELIEYKNEHDIVKRVTDGEVEYGLSYSSIIADYLNGEPIVLVANFFKQSPLVLVTQKDIDTIPKLKGKKVMGVSNSIDNITLLTMLNKFGLSTNDIQNIPATFDIEDFIAKKVDAMSVFTTNELYQLNTRGIKYNLFDPTAYGAKYYDVNLFTSKKEAILNPSRVEKFKEASIKGWEYALKHQEEIVELILEKYNTQNKTKEALAFEAKQIEQIMLSSVHEIGSIDNYRVKAIADNFLEAGFIENIKNKDLKLFIFDNSDKNTVLNNEEYLYLKNKKEIKMCVDPNWMPFEKIENGKYIGLASDYMKLFSQKIDTPITLVQTSTWTQSLEKIKNRECDILPLATRTITREKFIDFTTSYIDIPVVVATKTGNPFIDDINKIKNKKLGIVKGYSLIERLKNRYPNINIVEVGSFEDGLKKVENGTIFGYLDNSIVVNHEIQKNYIGTIAISGKFKEKINLSVATRNDEKILNQIFEKLILGLELGTKEKILNKWVNISYAKKNDYALVWQILIVASIIFIFFIYRQYVIRKSNLKLEENIIELKLIKDRFQLAIDGANDGLWDRNLLTEEVYYSPTFKEQIGYKDDELSDSIDEWVKRVHPDDIEKTSRDVENYFQGKTDLYQNEHRLKHKDGSWIWVLSRAKALFDSDGKAIRLVGFHTDITRQKELEENLQQLVDEKIAENIKQREILYQQNKLIAMGEMIENIAHQWRQPLSQINSAVLIVDDELYDIKVENKIIADKLNEIESMTEYMSNTINDFKSFYAKDKTKELFNLNDSIQTSTSLVKASFKYNRIELSINIDKDAQISGFKNEFQQSILVILNNAKDILVASKIENPKVSINLEITNSLYILSISNNGDSIDKGIIDKIFEPYFTTKHQSQGTGLGLYLSKKILEESMNARFYVKNIKNGVCFYIEFDKES